MKHGLFEAKGRRGAAEGPWLQKCHADKGLVAGQSRKRLGEAYPSMRAVGGLPPMAFFSMYVSTTFLGVYRGYPRLR